MKIQEINAAMDNLKEQCGGALVSSSVISFQYGQSIASYNSTDRGDALLAKFTTFVIETMDKCSFGKIGDYYTIKFEGGMYAIVAIFQDYCWGGLINANEMSLGMIMNVVLPDCIERFKKALS